MPDTLPATEVRPAGDGLDMDSEGKELRMRAKMKTAKLDRRICRECKHDAPMLDASGHLDRRCPKWRLYMIPRYQARSWIGYHSRIGNLKPLGEIPLHCPFRRQHQANFCGKE